MNENYTVYMLAAPMKNGRTKRTYKCYGCDSIIDTESTKTASYPMTEHTTRSILAHRNKHTTSMPTKILNEEE